MNNTNGLIYRRVGFAQPKEAAGTTTIPATITQLLEEYDVVETIPTAPAWDFMWNAVVEEGREKRMMRQSFTKKIEEMPAIGELSPEHISLAESAMKVPYRRKNTCAGSYICLDDPGDA